MPASLHAAVRTCGPIVSTDIVSAATETSAKALALKDWQAKARTFGPNFDSWRLAYNKALKCFPASGGASGFECVAVGAPCVIQQAPRAKPAVPDGPAI